MLLKNNISDLKKVVKEGNVLFSEEERYCYAQDATNMRDKITTPDIVIFAESIKEVQNVVKYANQHKIAVVARGAGTNMVGACTCSRGGIVLNFARMNKILDFSPENMTMRVQPGVVVGEIKNLAESVGLFYPPDPSCYRVSTIGGSIAQSSGGAKSFKYGTTKDYILSLTVVLADGTITKLGAGTIKDAAGYHLNQLIIGSEGTLGIVVEAEIKLIPKPETSRLITAYFDTYEDVVHGVNNIIKEQVFPSTIDFMDNNAIKTVEKFYPSGLNTDKKALLLIEIDGYESSMHSQADRVINALTRASSKEIKVLSDMQAMEDVWTARRSSFASAAQLAPDVVTDDIIVPRKSLAQMITGCIEICKKRNLTVCLVGHIGDGNLHPQIALNLDNDIEFKNYIEAKSEMYSLAISLGGTISAEHGIGIEKMSYLSQTVDNKSIEYMKKIKKIFDPNNILNPDKIFKL